MKRRGLLRTAALLGAGGVAWWYSDRGPVTGHRFRVLRRECGRTETTATVEWGAESVRVVGSFEGGASCSTAFLDSIDYDSADDRLVVSVISGQADGESCGWCISEIHYRAVVQFDGFTPATVAVMLDHDRVAVVDRDDAVPAGGSRGAAAR